MIFRFLASLSRPTVWRVNRVLQFFGREVTNLSNNGAPPGLRYAVRIDRAAHAMLDPGLRDPVEWRSEDRAAAASQLTSGPLARIWREIPQGHKWLNYFPVYEELCGHLRDQRPRMLEIGVYRGASVEMWRRYLGAGATIVGVDIDPACARFERADDGIHIRIGSQDDAAFLRRVVAEFGPFDLIIDDGSHLARHQIASFNALFADGLRDGGIYLVEDLECHFWQDADFRQTSVSFNAFAAHLGTLMHLVYNRYGYADFDLNNPTARTGYVVPRIVTMLHCIRMYDSMISLHKARTVPPITQHL